MVARPPRASMRDMRAVLCCAVLCSQAGARKRAGAAEHAAAAAQGPPSARKHACCVWCAVLSFAVLWCVIRWAHAGPAASPRRKRRKRGEVAVTRGAVAVRQEA